MAIGQGSTELGRNMSLINHRQHARFMALSAVEEMHNILWIKLSNPMTATDTRKEVIQAVLGGGVYEMDLLSELKRSNKLYNKQEKATSFNKSKATISIFEATAEFHNLKRLLTVPQACTVTLTLITDLQMVQQVDKQLRVSPVLTQISTDG